MKRGLFRLWLAVTLLWLASVGFVLRYDLVADCDHLFLTGYSDFPMADCKLAPSIRGDRAFYLTDGQWLAIYWLVIPALGVLALGLLAGWVASGFRSKISN